jgi:hypothetical protein
MFHRGTIWFMSINTNDIIHCSSKTKDYEKNLELGEILKLRPFGETLHHGLQNAKFDTNNSYAM